MWEMQSRVGKGAHRVPVLGHILEANRLADVDQIQNVLLEARASEADRCVQELWPYARVRANRVRYLFSPRPPPSHADNPTLCLTEFEAHPPKTLRIYLLNGLLSDNRLHSVCTLRSPLQCKCIMDFYPSGCLQVYPTRKSFRYLPRFLTARFPTANLDCRERRKLKAPKWPI